MFRLGLFANNPRQPPARAPVNSLSLRFEDSALESAFQRRQNARAITSDQQAAAVYLFMVASGSLLYLAIAFWLPQNRVASIDNCTSLIICSWIGPAAHLLLLFLVPGAWYARHRTAIQLAFRLFYLGATSINGFGMCGVGPVNATARGLVVLEPAAAAAAPPGPASAAAAAGVAAVAAAAQRQLESPFSALLWRSGIIGMTWYAGAFPLLFWQHCLVQSTFIGAYYATLSHQVCSTRHGVAQGSQAISAVLCLGHGLWAALLAVVGATGLATEHAQKAAAAAAAALSGSAPGTAAAVAAAAGGYGGCMRGVCFLQLLLGHALPSLVLYCAEARTRAAWWLALQRSSATGSSRRSTGGCGGLPAGAGSLRPSSSRESLCGGCEALQPAQEECGQDLTGGDCSAAAAAVAASVTLQQGLVADGLCGAGGKRLLRRSSSGSSSSSEAAGAASSSSSGSSSSSLELKPWAKQQQLKLSSTAGLQRGSGAGAGSPGGLLVSNPALFDRFDVEMLHCGLPPGGAEVFVMLLLLGLAWQGLGAAFGSGG